MHVTHSPTALHTPQAQSQAVEDPPFKHGVADIVTPECPPNGTHHRGGDEGEGGAVDDDQREGGGGFDGAGVKPRGTQRALRGGGGSGKEWKSDNGPKWLLESAVHQIHHLWRDDDTDDGGHRPDWIDDDDAASEDDWIEGGLHHCQDSDTRCCGDMIPKCCRMTGHVKKVMENYYPEIVYFAFDKETGLMETIEPPEAQ